MQATQGTKGFTPRKKQLCGKKKAKTLDRILTEGGTDELQDEARTKHGGDRKSEVQNALLKQSGRTPEERRRKCIELQMRSADSSTNVHVMQGEKTSHENWISTAAW